MGTEVRQIVGGVEMVIVLIVVVLGSARPTMVEIGPGPSGTVSGGWGAGDLQPGGRAGAG
ncbi:MAG: hypothetical protein HOH95_02075 [Dehalococcoidia bacterium]|jgi:hypothetical protein|nr:hypothetical protein [Dehalococcoidia bacterium]